MKEIKEGFYSQSIFLSLWVKTLDADRIEFGRVQEAYVYYTCMHQHERAVLFNTGGRRKFAQSATSYLTPASLFSSLSDHLIDNVNIERPQITLIAYIN